MTPTLKPVKVSSGWLQGQRHDGLDIYKGIPFAKPPLGALRWRAPQPSEAWDGVRAAEEFAPAPMQAPLPFEAPGWQTPESMSEDCLYLNIWAPAEPRLPQPLPVMVWFYGGAFRAGCASAPLYRGDQLARKDVVVVTFNYRVGALGFLGHPELSRESSDGVSGNYGLLDQIAALRWVQDNIAAFGGDPANVTVFGESAGAMAIHLLSLSPQAKGLFHRVIAQSGACFAPARRPASRTALPGENLQFLTDALEQGSAFAQGLGAAALDQLRSLPAKRIAQANDAGSSWPVIDGWLVPDDIHSRYERGDVPDLPMLLGFNADEGVMFAPPAITAERFRAYVAQRYGRHAGALLQAYPADGDEQALASLRALTGDSLFGWPIWTWARLQSQATSSGVYLYAFEHRPPYPALPRYSGVKAMHGAEIAYVFQHLLPADWAWTGHDHELSEALACYWTQFARSGNPNDPARSAGLPLWPRYDESQACALRIDQSLQPGPLPNLDALQLLDVYFRERLQSSS